MDKNGNALITLGMMSLLVFCAFFIGTNHVPKELSPIDQGVHYDGIVCVAKNDELAQCKHNLITNQGKNMIKNALTNGSIGFPLNITVSNYTEAVATDTALPGYAAICAGDANMCGVNGSLGTYGIGNWSISKTFTASVARTYNTTGLYGTEVGGTVTSLFAGNTYTEVALQPNDQLTINWTIYVT